MIVPVFNYHLSIITIMGKNNKSLYISILSNFRYILKLIQNRLNRLVFSWKQATFLPKTTWKVSSDPGGRAWEIRVWRRWRPGSRETGTGMWSCLSTLFEEILCTVSDYNPVEYLLFWPRFWWGFPNEVAVSFRYSNKNIIFATIQHNYAGRWKQNKMESVPSRR